MIHQISSSRMELNAGKVKLLPPDSIVLQKSNQDVMPFLTGGILMIGVVKDRSLGGEVLHFQDEVQDVSNKF